jgi:hypothetical protein
LVGQESHFQKNLDKSLELYASLKESLLIMDKEMQKKSVDTAKVKK